MSEQLQQALAALLNKTVSGVEAGTAFLLAEIPDVIQQLLMWKLAQASVMSVACIAGFVAAFFVLRAVVKHTENDGFLSLEYVGIPAICVSGVVIGLSISGLFSYGSDALQIWLAPKIYLIEYAASLAK